MLRIVATIRAHQNVLANFIARDLKVKYRSTFFGYLWSLLEPLSLVAIYWFVFEVVVDRKTPAYPLLVILGVLPYNFMSNVITAGSTALVGNAALVRRVALPREVYVLSAVGSQLIIFFLSMIAVIPFLIIYRFAPSLHIWAFFLSTVLMTLFSTGIAMIAACANVILRDVGYVLRVTLRIFFYASPVIYSITIMSSKPTLLWWYLWNPVSVYLTLARASIMNQPLLVPMPQLAFSIVAAIATFMIGSAIFRAWEKKAVKFL